MSTLNHLAVAAALAALAGCANLSTDPREGGFLGGVSGLNSGAYEARVHEVESRNKVVEGLGGKLITGSIVGAGIYTAGRVAEKSIENAGDQTNIQGDGNSYTQERVSSNADITSKNFGEGGTATSGAPTVSGPDKSSHTTIEAAEEPVVEEPEVEEPEGEFVPTEPPDFPEGPVEIPGPPSAE